MNLTFVRFLSLSPILLLPFSALADAPVASYIYPAGGQRGTSVDVRVGALNLLDQGEFLISGKGVKAVRKLPKMNTLWFEGPRIRQPASQRRENYPKDFRNTISIASSAELGSRTWRLTNSQGVTAGKKFLIGDLPEVVEDEIDGRPIPVPVNLPVTINGRIFPREDIDIWTFEAKAGDVLTCDVNAQRLGSPLDSQLEVRGPDGRRLAENGDANGLDSQIRFTAPTSGVYQVRIRDANFNGLQDHVYRLTITSGPWLDAIYPLGGRRGEAAELECLGHQVPDKKSVNIPATNLETTWHRAAIDEGTTNPVLFDLDDLPEFREERISAAESLSLPAVLNGRILQAGEEDAWTFSAAKGEEWTFEVKASRLGSPLDAVLSLYSPEGKLIAEADDADKGQTDPILKAKIPAEGIYELKIRDRFSSAGPRHSYRIRCAQPPPPGFSIEMPAGAFTLTRGTDLKIKANINRFGGFKEPIQLRFEGLPKEISATNTTVPKNKNSAQIVLKAAANTPVALHRFRITGEAAVSDGEAIQQAGRFLAGPGEEPVEEFFLKVAIPTPFKFSAEFATKYSNRGSMFSRRYQLDRGGYEGPLEIRLADAQIRHLQGVTAEPITLDPNADSFEYAISLPPWMEVGRTSRTCLMAVGTIKDFDGSEHRVCYSSTAQNDQMIILTDPERLGIRLERSSLRAVAERTAEIGVEVQRGVGLSGAVRVNLDVPAHIRGISAEPITISQNEAKGKLTIDFGESPGPFNQPLTIRADILDEDRRPVTAEAKLEIVAPGSR